MLSKVKRMKYSVSFKLQVVKFASDNSNNSAASWKFGIDEKLVRDWRRKIDNIKSLPKTKCADRGRKCQWPELEKKVVEWVEENRKSGARRDKNCQKFARQKNHTTNEYRQFPRLKWVVHSVHEAEQTRAVPENENITMWNFKRPGRNRRWFSVVRGGRFISSRRGTRLRCLRR